MTLSLWNLPGRMFEQYYLYFKAFHLIFIVSWFAGLFYIVRLFIYITEANNKKEPEKTILQKQLILMAKRLQNIISTPAMYLTIVFGTMLIMANPGVMKAGWFHIKLTGVLLLMTFHFYNSKLLKDFNNGIFKLSSEKLRVLNEVPTLFLFAIVFLVVLKNTLSMLIGFLGMFVLAILLMMGIKIYRLVRKDEV